MRVSGECCHYDDGYDDGLADGKRTLGNVDAPLEVARLLLRASRELYAADRLSVTALDCERYAHAIALEYAGGTSFVFSGAAA